MKNFSYLLLVTLFFSACTTDFQLEGEWKDIPVVYGFISVTDTAHYVRVEKAFLEPGGDANQIAPEADAILLLSLISGRNPELLIGKHVTSAIHLKRSGLEIISTGYMLIDGGVETTASYVTGTSPLPSNKPGIAAMTGLAGEQLGLKVLYMDAGSGAREPVPASLIHAVRSQVSIPIIVGGGIRNKKGILEAWNAGADVVVIGNALEENPELLPHLRAELIGSA